MGTGSDQTSCTVIIVNYNGADCLQKCLQALSNMTLQPQRVVVADNGSTDGSFEAVKDFTGLSNLVLQDMGSNLGFAAANNAVVSSISDSKWVLLLNPDAYPEPDWLECLLRAANASPEFHFFASRMMVAGQPGVLDGAGDSLHVAGLPWRTGHGVPCAEHHLIKKEVFSPCGGAALYLTSAFVEVGGFDEDFFCYVEDVDLSFRLRLLGYRCQYVPEAVVQHVGSGITGKGSDFVVYHGHRNLVWMFLKNMPTLLLLLFLPVHCLMTCVVGVNLTFRGKGRVYCRAKLDAVRLLRKILAKRQVVQARRKITLWRLLRLLNFRMTRR